METTTLAVRLSENERRVVYALREIPVSPLKDLTGAILDELLEFVREPKCAELQADGAPCATPTADCEQCAKLREVLDHLRRRIAAASS